MHNSAAMPEHRKPPRRQEDTEPWYRQFWPWFLIALPGSVVIAGLGTVYIAFHYADDLVADDYYKDGMAINQQLDKQRIASERGISAQIQVLDKRAQVRLSGSTYPETLTLRFSHPLEADLDFNVLLDRVAPGLYDAVLPASVAPNWHWILDAGGNDWRLDGSLSARDFIDRPLSAS